MTPIAVARAGDTRWLALGGVIGPVAFVGSWAILGATTPGYSPVNGAISDLAAVDASSRAAMTAGFVVFGVGLIAFGFALRDALEGPAWIAAIATGGCTIGVAATPLGGWAGDNAHAAFAGLGYATLVALPLLAARPLARCGLVRCSRASILAGLVAAFCLAASTFGPVHGLWQRLGLTTGDVWIVAAAVTILAPSGRRRAGGRDRGLR